MVICVNNIILSILPNRKALQQISTKLLLKCLKDLKILGQDMHFKLLPTLIFCNYIYLKKKIKNYM